MSSRTPGGVAVAAIALGLFGDQLARAPVWGLNLALWSLALAGQGLILARERSRDDGSPWPWLGAAFFTAMWAVRDAPALLAFDLLAALGLLSLAIARAQGTRLIPAGAVEVVAAPVRAAWHTLTGGARLVLVWRPWDGVESMALRHAGSLGLGLLLAIPPVLVFGGLFASADPIFSSAVTTLFRADLEPLASHVAVASILTWVSAGVLCAAARPASRWSVPTPSVALGVVPVLTALGATALLFTVFVALQAGSLFGGEAFVREQTGLTYAEYARRGFFQMVFASALSLPLVYAAPFASGQLDERGTGSLRALLAVQLALTGLVLASALWRMKLYVGVYGLTEDRLYGTTAMVWIAATIAVFGGTVLRGRPRGAMFGSIVAAAAALTLLNVVNPKATIARYNLAHQDRRAADLEHLVELGGDAVPVLVGHLDDVPAERRCELARALHARYRVATGDWRGWNLGRARAQKAARSLEPVVRSCPPALPSPVSPAPRPT